MSENESLKKNKSNKKRKKKIILISTLGVLAILIAVIFGYYIQIRNRVYIKSTPKATEENKATRYETATSQDTFYNLFKKLFHTYLNSDAKKASPY